MTTDPAGDRCPGVLRLFPAADGGIARLRFPGGRLRPEDWTLLASLASEFGDGDIHLTSRGNLQIRGVRDPESFAAAVAEAGGPLDATHDRVRNVLASPLAGRVAGRADVGDLPERLDAEIRARDDATGLSGRFLFGIDDGSGDVLAHRPDLAASLSAADPGRAALMIAGAGCGLVLDTADVPRVLVDGALAFAEGAGGDWRIGDSSDHPVRVRSALAEHPLTGTDPLAPATVAEVPPVGWIDADDGTVSLLAVTPFGVIPARLAEFLGAVDRPSTVSADKVVGLHGLTESMAEQVVRVLAPMGLVLDADSPWVDVTACTGRPGCEKALADVRYDAADAVRSGTLPVPGRQHWVGCERRCGHPGHGSTVLATVDGYRVESPGDHHEEDRP